MHVLIVEDDLHIHQMLVEYFTKEGAVCVSAYSGSEAELRIQQERFDVILMDLMLPGISGEALIPKIKQNTSAVVIVISAKDDIDTKVALLQQGADDYICKPFDLKEVKARMELRMRHLEHPANTSGLILHEDLRTVSIQGRKQTLTKREYRIVKLLVSHPKRAFTKQDIYEYAWDGETYIEDKTINVHISNLRSKLSEITDEEVIETIWGIGFKWKE